MAVSCRSFFMYGSFQSYAFPPLARICRIWSWIDQLQSAQNHQIVDHQNRKYQLQQLDGVNMYMLFSYSNFSGVSCRSIATMPSAMNLLGGMCAAGAKQKCRSLEIFVLVWDKCDSYPYSASHTMRRLMLWVERCKAVEKISGMARRRLVEAYSKSSRSTDESRQI